MRIYVPKPPPLLPGRFLIAKATALRKTAEVIREVKPLRGKAYEIGRCQTEAKTAFRNSVRYTFVLILTLKSPTSRKKVLKSIYDFLFLLLIILVHHFIPIPHRQALDLISTVFREAVFYYYKISLHLFFCPATRYKPFLRSLNCPPVNSFKLELICRHTNAVQ